MLLQLFKLKLKFISYLFIHDLFSQQRFPLTHCSYILFCFSQVTKAVHLCVGSDSHVRVYQPWTVNEYGYTTSVVAKLFQVEATTSLAYRQLIEADVMDVSGETVPFFE